MTAKNDLRADLLVALEQLGRLRPEWRLGQTLANLAMTAGRMDTGGVWDLDDAEALTAARELIDQYGFAAISVPTLDQPLAAEIPATAGV